MVGLIGINCSDRYISYEDDRVFLTDGKKHKHPSQEATEAEPSFLAEAKPSLDEFMILRSIAINTNIYLFSWVDYNGPDLEYSALLT